MVVAVFELKFAHVLVKSFAVAKFAAVLEL